MVTVSSYCFLVDCLFYKIHLATFLKKSYFLYLVIYKNQDNHSMDNNIRLCYDVNIISLDS